MGDSEKVVPTGSILEIDEHNLEGEWTKQPKLFWRWAGEAANARHEVDKMKAALEIARTEIDLEVRSGPEKFGIEGKLTENVVKAIVVQSSVYISAERKVLKAKHRHDIVSALVSALEQRKSALENLVRLYLSSYYAEPKTPKDSQEGLEEMQKDRAFKPRRRREDG